MKENLRTIIGGTLVGLITVGGIYWANQGREKNNRVKYTDTKIKNFQTGDYPGDFEGTIGEYTVSLKRNHRGTDLEIDIIDGKEIISDRGNNNTVDSYAQHVSGGITLSIDSDYTKKTLQQAQEKYDMILALIKENKK